MVEGWAKKFEIEYGFTVSVAWTVLLPVAVKVTMVDAVTVELAIGKETPVSVAGIVTEAGTFTVEELLWRLMTSPFGPAGPLICTTPDVDKDPVIVEGLT